MVNQSQTPKMKRWGNRTNAQLRKKRNLITSVLLCKLPLQALQLFCYLVQLLFFVLDLSLLCRLVLNLLLICCLFLLILKPSLLCHLVLYRFNSWISSCFIALSCTWSNSCSFCIHGSQNIQISPVRWVFAPLFNLSCRVSLSVSASQLVAQKNRPQADF